MARVTPASLAADMIAVKAARFDLACVSGRIPDAIMHCARMPSVEAVATYVHDVIREVVWQFCGRNRDRSADAPLLPALMRLNKVHDVFDQVKEFARGVSAVTLALPHQMLPHSLRMDCLTAFRQSIVHETGEGILYNVAIGDLAETACSKLRQSPTNDVISVASTVRRICGDLATIKYISTELGDDPIDLHLTDAHTAVAKSLAAWARQAVQIRRHIRLGQHPIVQFLLQVDAVYHRVAILADATSDPLIESVCNPETLAAIARSILNCIRTHTMTFGLETILVDVKDVAYRVPATDARKVMAYMAIINTVGVSVGLHRKLNGHLLLTLYALSDPKEFSSCVEEDCNPHTDWFDTVYEMAREFSVEMEQRKAESLVCGYITEFMRLLDDLCISKEGHANVVRIRQALLVLVVANTLCQMFMADTNLTTVWTQMVCREFMKRGDGSSTFVSLILTHTCDIGTLGQPLNVLFCILVQQYARDDAIVQFLFNAVRTSAGVRHTLGSHRVQHVHKKTGIRMLVLGPTALSQGRELVTFNVPDVLSDALRGRRAFAEGVKRKRANAGQMQCADKYTHTIYSRGVACLKKGATVLLSVHVDIVVLAVLWLFNHGTPVSIAAMRNIVARHGDTDLLVESLCADKVLAKVAAEMYVIAPARESDRSRKIATRYYIGQFARQLGCQVPVYDQMSDWQVKCAITRLLKARVKESDKGLDLQTLAQQVKSTVKDARVLGPCIDKMEQILDGLVDGGFVVKGQDNKYSYLP